MIHKPKKWQAEGLEVAQLVAKTISTPVDIITSPSRHAHAVSARRIVFSALRQMGFSLLGIKWLTGYCHTTIMPALKRLTADEEVIAGAIAAELRPPEAKTKVVAEKLNHIEEQMLKLGETQRQLTRQAIHMYEQGFSVPFIARQIGCGPTWVYDRFKDLKVPMRSKSEATTLHRKQSPNPLSSHPWKRANGERQ